MTAQNPTFAARDGLLRRTLQVDGIICLLSGAALAGAATALAGLTGLSANLLVAAGLFLLPYGALLLWGGSRPQIDRRLAWFSIACDDLWVVGCIALLLGAAQPTTLGWWLIVDLAIAVAVIGTLKYFGLRRAA